MTRNVQFAFIVVAMFFGCLAVEAQTRGGGSMPARVAPMPIASMGRASGSPGAPISSGARAARQGTVIQISPGGRSVSGTGSFANSFNFTGQNGVPGLGFDFPHQAAVGGNFRFNPPGFGRGMNHHRDFGGNFGAGILFGGFPYYSDFSDYQQEPQQPQQPQVIVIQQPVPAAPSEQQAAPSRDTIPEAAQPAPPPAPVRDIGEFILVRRDGRIVFASVFSVTGSQVQYVTPEGIRRVLPLGELDTAATQEMNEARGTTLQFQN